MRDLPDERRILTDDGLPDITGTNQTLGQCIREVCREEGRLAIDVRPREESIRGGLSRAISVIVNEDAHNGTTVARDPSIFGKAPGVPQDVLQKELVRARRDPVHGIVRAHDAPDLRVPDAALERREIVFREVLLSDYRIERVAQDTFPVL